MKVFFSCILFIVTVDFCKAEKIDIISVSQQLLLSVKTNIPSDSLVHYLATIPEDILYKELNNDINKKTFWINIYNAYTQLLLNNNQAIYTKRNAFFGKKQIIISGRNLSLDNIEHGILRRSKNKWSLGYFNSLFPSKFEKQNRVDSVDYQIHFALNCGAKSCPPIAFYTIEKLDQQLTTATKAYLQGETIWMDSSKTIYLPKMMSWFRADFGGKKGMKDLIKQYSLAPTVEKIKIHFKPYDWTLFLAQFQN
ncbi:MAG: DUF547 domain-containing protein [Sphingobacteriia bacterium]|nr:MAG: DUF547 domain-containing protein [Sphingobacteriia bacterium]